MLLELAWLPRPPLNFREQLRDLRETGTVVTSENRVRVLRSLAECALDLNQLGQLAGTASRIEDLPGLHRVRLGILGDGNQDISASAIAGSALRHGVAVEIVNGNYGSMVQQATDPLSPVRAANPDVVLVAPDYRMLGLGQAQLGTGAAENAVSAAIATLKQIVGALRSWVPGGILLQTVVPPLEPLFGSLDAIQPGSTLSMVNLLNQEIARWATNREVVLVDVARAASWVGLDNWSDPARWNSAKLPCALDAIPLYADIVSRTLAATTVGLRKCLVLDLDNTLWGGVIGDDGVEGIVLGQGSAAGESFLAIQRLAIELRSRGVVLAVCSKNELEAALLPFQKHPEMLLKESDFAVFQANWVDKASNLRAIASALNIDVSALVLLDDNPAERSQVRNELPMVGVPELPEDPALYPRALQCAGYFDTVAFLEEDRSRSDYYTENSARRAVTLEQGSDIASYLRSLNMVCEMRPFDSVGLTRIAQLVNKSNQYNLTTRRYTEPAISKIQSDPSRYTLQIRLTDRFGDNGMISVVIFNTQGGDGFHDAWVNDTWLMSCRVLGRRVEEAALATVAAAARKSGVARLVGYYVPSLKNRMVADHYERLGFVQHNCADSGNCRWELRLEHYVAPDLPMQLIGDAVVL